MKNDILKQNSLSIEKMNKRIQSNRVLKNNDLLKKEDIVNFDFSAISSVDQNKENKKEKKLNF